jgi:hypothetical protein
MDIIRLHWRGRMDRAEIAENTGLKRLVGVKKIRRC